MKSTLQLRLAPRDAMEGVELDRIVRQELGVEASRHLNIVIQKRSIDARSKKVKINLLVDVYVDEDSPPNSDFTKNYPNVNQKPQAIVVGMGPAGIFAALKLIEHGIKPIILERGKDVRSRRRDLAAINKHHQVNPESNYCFGEGGAGTYSDGKLYTRSKKRGNVKRMLEVLVAHGASSDILIDAHPHIGTNKLPKVVSELRNSIIEAGGEIHFGAKVTDFLIDDQEIKGVEINQNETLKGIGVILATGHSARDIFECLHKKNITIYAKPFAMGVRVEHPQLLIDQIQYHCSVRDPYLPASAYALNHQVMDKSKGKRGVFSFCMCPGGFIVPAATAPGEIVVNGMSPSRRDSRFANSGMVAEVALSDFMNPGENPLDGMYFQQKVEQKAFKVSGGTQSAPAQRLLDFVNGKTSSELLETSYQPGLVSVDLCEVLPEFISNALRHALKAFDRKMKGYLTNDAQIIGVESRTSSPVTIPRDRESAEHIEIRRLFPCGEGAGYAGGIVSAALDGEFCANQLAWKYAGKREYSDKE